MNPVEPVIDVSGWAPDDEEPLGARDKFWIRESTDPEAPCWLFKRPRAIGLPEFGADLWAEVLASRIAELLPLPAAEARFALWQGQPGVISKRVGDGLVHGNELLSSRNPGYRTAQVGPVPGYDLDAIAVALDGYAGSETGLSAFESFTGYLTFDALVGNTDRHHENWAVLTGSQSLAPTYDHGASLGFNASTARRVDPEAFAERGRARHFPGGPRLNDLAHQALGRVDDSVRALWLDRVSALDAGMIRDAISAVPGGWMSDGARTFVDKFIATNQRRLTP